MKKVHNLEKINGGDCINAVLIGAGIGGLLGSIGGPFGTIGGAAVGGSMGYILGC